MFTTNMIKYEINEETKVITASVEGIKDDALETFTKALRTNSMNLSYKDMIVELIPDEDGKYSDEGITVHDVDLTTCHKYHLPDSLSAHAKYDSEDPHDYSVERGKQIARRRLYNKYNKAYMNAMNEIMFAIQHSMETMNDKMLMTHDRIINFNNFEHYHIFKHDI